MTHACHGNISIFSKSILLSFIFHLVKQYLKISVYRSPTPSPLISRKFPIISCHFPSMSPQCPSTSHHHFLSFPVVPCHFLSIGNFPSFPVISHQRSPSRSYSDQIRPNPTKSNQIWPNPTESDQIRPNLTDSDQIRLIPTNSERFRSIPTYSDLFRPIPTNSDQIRPKIKIRPNPTKSNQFRPNPTKSDQIRPSDSVGFSRSSFWDGTSSMSCHFPLTYRHPRRFPANPVQWEITLENGKWREMMGFGVEINFEVTPKISIKN